MSEIIDLTLASSPIIVDNESDLADIPSSGSNDIREDPVREKKRARKKKKKRSIVEDGELHETSRADHGEKDTNSSSSLFFIDIKPARTLEYENGNTSAALEEEPRRLLLPGHVSVLNDVQGAVPIQAITRSTPDSDEEEYIEYLDYDDRKAPGMVRYFEEELEEPKQKKYVCKNCGEEGSHKTYECPVQICLTCGARNEHSTRSCPISKTCFTCGMKGHINRTCPQRFSARTANSGNYDDCDRCGSSRHNTNECHTLWRMYEYVSDVDRGIISRIREEKRGLGIGNGGESYIATDEWCYNCGDCGHLGDDCNVVAHPHDHPREPSAFSAYNTMSGPFFDSTAESSRGPPREPRDWESADQLPDGWGLDAPLNVGKQGRRKDRARMEKTFKEAEDESDDWFGNPRNARNHGAMQPPSSKRSGLNDKGTKGKKITFGNLGQNKDRKFDFAAPTEPARARQSEEKFHDGRNNGRGFRDRHDYDRRPPESFSPYDTSKSKGASYDASNGFHRERYRQREPEPGRRAHREERGPRYRGGYS